MRQRRPRKGERLRARISLHAQREELAKLDLASRFLMWAQVAAPCRVLIAAELNAGFQYIHEAAGPEDAILVLPPPR